MTMLKKLPEEVLNLWNKWEIRGMVLLSLLLQTILIIFGSRRKTTGRIWIRILVWSAYLSADMVATVALGTLARSQGDSSDFWESYRRTGISETPPQDHQRDYLLQAYVFSNISKFMMQDVVPGISSLIRCRELISKNKADGAFKVVEAELGLIYDMLYTKAPLIYSRAGIILRCISSLLSVTAFITFQVKIDKHDYSKTDIAITYLLFAAAVFLEFYAFLCLVLSDWTMIWLIDKGGNGLPNATYSLIRKLTRGERWSRSISQYNLKSSSIKSEPHGCLGLLGIDEMMRQMHVNRKDLNVGLQGLIFEHLREKAQKIKEDLNVFDKYVRSKIIGQRGDGVLEREGLLRDFKWCTTEVEFSRSILVWHLATDTCYRVDMKEADAYLNKDGSNVSKEYETSRCLSEYMMYLLVIRPNMLSKGFGDDEGYLDTLRELRDLKYHGDVYDEEYQLNLRGLWGLKDRGPDDEGYQRILRELRNSESRDYDDGFFQRRWITEKSVAPAYGVVVLARQLLLLEPEKRWEMINEVWIEMLAYAAAHCSWKEHTQQLRRGGELLTHVSLLMIHLGLSEQYEYKELHEHAFLHYTGEEQHEYGQAREKYLKDIKDKNMLGLSADEELKELRKIVADKDQELERKNQELEREKRELEREKRELEHKNQELEREKRELEQLRSYLIASAPQQGIDSLPRSLLAQTDDQGTGQPPSNNEISLSIE
ncbi:hypothetical protein H0E87_025502 [Populus deltoides]|uniref:DUF4220 domain-containing protein n=1 Tax=Populus deltoides TaxID=3696 RepID=A0A8T2X3E5_POPDE|nr:hypothetical protein H0E87_025502 [Populus deltoides]